MLLKHLKGADKMKQALNCYKNKETGELKKIWETESQYENHKGDFDIKWEQISYDKYKGLIK